MIRNLTLSGLAALAMCATASASNFSVSGAGGAIPDCPLFPGPWNAAPTWATFTSTVSVANPVTSITKVKLDGLNHTFRGDIHIFLSDPAGVRYNVIVRAGYIGSGYGDGGDYSTGSFEFVQTGGGNVAQGATNITGGLYNQYFNTGAGSWTSGTYAIANTPLNSITGPAGTWTLNVVDWTQFDTGSLTGWTLEGTDASGVGTVFCVPGVDAMACPCLNPGGAGKGCANNGPLDNGTSGVGGGGSLAAAGVADLSMDATDPGSLSLTGTGMYAGTACIFAMGPALVAGGSIAFGAGVRCAGGSLVRLYTKTGANFVGGSATAPQPADRSISNRTLDLGAAPIVPGTYYFQTYYRDPNIVAPFVTPGNPGCPPNFTFNMTSGQAIVWVP